MKPVLASLALFLASGALAAVGLEVQVDARPIKENAAKPTAASSALERVRIDGSWLVAESATHRVVIDFAARRKYVVDLAAASYSEGSLFADAGFRGFEILNREILARALSAAKHEKAINAIALAEHELSVAHPRQPGKVEAQTNADGARFLIGDLVVFSFSAKGSALSESDAAGLGRYLRYFKNGHPVALRALQDRRMAPSGIGLVSGPFQAVQTTLRVRVIPLGEAPLASVQGLKKVPPRHGILPDDLSLAAFRIAASSSDDIGRSIENAGRRAESLVREGKVVPGFFAALEYLLQGAPAHELMRRNRDAFTGSPELQAIMPALNNAANKADAEKALAVLAAARAKGGEEASVLGVFEANHHTMLGRERQATELFTAALRRNSYLAGAWKDLGDVLFRQYDTPAAWLCWDTGRRIAPQFANFAKINEFEQRLLRDLPEYF